MTTSSRLTRPGCAPATALGRTDLRLAASSHGHATALIALTMLLLLVVSCGTTPLSINPLPRTGDEQPDVRLWGVWHGSNAEFGDVIIQIGDGQNNTAAVVVSTFKKNGKIDGIGLFDMYTTNIGNQTLMSLKIPDEFLEAYDNFTYNIFARYELDGPETLTIYLMSIEETRKAIMEGHIKGDTGNQSATITDSPENIARFIRQAETRTLYSKFVTARRLFSPDH